MTASHDAPIRQRKELNGIIPMARHWAAIGAPLRCGDIVDNSIYINERRLESKDRLFKHFRDVWQERL
jgi:hypothetical protein